MKRHGISTTLKVGLLAASALSLGGAATAVAAPALPAAPASQVVQFSLFLPLQNKAGLTALLAAQQNKASPSYHKWLTPDQFATQFGPSATTIAQAKAALTTAGLQVNAVSGRAIQVSATVAQVNTAFKLSLKSTGTGKTARLIALTKPVLPGVLGTIGAVTPAFAPVPLAETHSRRLAGVTPDNRRSAVGGYYYNDLKQAYDYPSYATILPGGARLDGTGVNVAIVMEDDAADSDIALMFAHENFTATTGNPAPTITHVPVNGGGVFGGPGTDEASLDVQQVLGGSPGAAVTLLSLPNLSNQNILDAYYFNVDLTNSYDIVSSSFGECSLFFTPAYNNGYDFTGDLALQNEIFQQGNSQGITFIASSGDSGGLGCPDNLYFAYGTTGGKFVKGTENPADDPNVTGVGGTNLVTSFQGPYVPGTSTIPKPSIYLRENGNGDPEVPYDPYGLGNLTGGYWGAGGGIDKVFAQPYYQTTAVTGATTRTVPDIGMQVGGCPGGISVTPCGPQRSYVLVWIGGGAYGLIGTSVAAPEFAGATALAVEAYGRVGNLNPYLYSKGAEQVAAGLSSAPADKQFYHMNIYGYDGAYTTSPSKGYNYITGYGTPDVRKLFGFAGYAPAGNPQTPSNP
jgi:subtilase family serine protease